MSGHASSWLLHNGEALKKHGEVDEWLTSEFLQHSVFVPLYSPKLECGG